MRREEGFRAEKSDTHVKARPSPRSLYTDVARDARESVPKGVIVIM